METQLDLFQFKTPTMPRLDLSRCYVQPINYETAARIVRDHHYAHRVPSIMVSLGMYVDEILAGVITFGMLPSPNAQSAALGEQYASNTLELNRLFVFDWAGRNSESWLIGQSFNHLSQNYPDKFILISYADTGENHIGYIYQATNWLYTGLSEPGGNGNYMLVDGKKMTTRNAYSIWGTQGIKELENLGFEVKKPKGTYKHRYVYFLGSKSQRRKLHKLLRWPILPYPKGN